MAKEFHLGDILSISTDRLVSPTRMDGVYDILNYMTGDNLFTHQLPRAMEECAPYLLDQMPWLAEIQPDDDVEDWEVWLLCQAAERGEYHFVQPIPADDHDIIDPVDELQQMMPGKPIFLLSSQPWMF